MKKNRKENDVVFRQFNEKGKKEHKSKIFDLYHCRCQKAIFSGEVFKDQYDSGLGGYVFTPEAIGDTIEVEFKGNLNDYMKVHQDIQYLKWHYAEYDIIDMTHRNSSNSIYLKKGAKHHKGTVEKSLIESIKNRKHNIDCEEKILRKDLRNYLELLGGRISADEVYVTF